MRPDHASGRHNSDFRDRSLPVAEASQIPVPTCRRLSTRVATLETCREQFHFQPCGHLSIYWSSARSKPAYADIGRRFLDETTRNRTGWYSHSDTACSGSASPWYCFAATRHEKAETG